jgi:hypothetical protein
MTNHLTATEIRSEKWEKKKRERERREREKEKEQEKYECF